MKKNLIHLLNLITILVLTISAHAQTISNVQFKYVCPNVEVTYTLSGCGGVSLYWRGGDTTDYHIASSSANWNLVGSYLRSAAGTYTNTWVCEGDPNAPTYGAIFFKLEPLAGCTPEPIAMILIEGGTFTLGAAVAAAADGATGNAAEPFAHSVRLSNFYMSKTQVTQAQFEEVMGVNPSLLQCENNVIYAPSGCKPVENVNWYHALAFCNKLSIIEGFTPVYSVKVSGIEIDWENLLFSAIPTADNANWNAATLAHHADGYRLPTEAEWEYAARGGNHSLTALYGTDDFYYSGGNFADGAGWFTTNSGSQTRSVAQKAANALGLYDMSGNVNEWCWDRYGAFTTTPPLKGNPMGPASGTSRMNRGGNWNYAMTNMRVTNRTTGTNATTGNTPITRNNRTGFRVVRQFPCNTTPDVVVINGVGWATRNVGAPGFFADCMMDYGMFYQWDINIGWSSADPILNTNGCNFDCWGAASGNTTWQSVNDPSPAGFRVPKDTEIDALLNTVCVDRVWSSEKGVLGYRFTDNGADGRGNAGNTIFLPAAGDRIRTNGALSSQGSNGYYWSDTQEISTDAYVLYFDSSNAIRTYSSKRNGMSVRPVSK